MQSSDLLDINVVPLSTPNSSTRLFANDRLLFRAVKSPNECRLTRRLGLPSAMAVCLANVVSSR